MNKEEGVGERSTIFHLLLREIVGRGWMDGRRDKWMEIEGEGGIEKEKEHPQKTQPKRVKGEKKGKNQETVGDGLTDRLSK
jgi:hypothetical protein